MKNIQSDGEHASSKEDDIVFDSLLRKSLIVSALVVLFGTADAQQN